MRDETNNTLYPKRSRVRTLSTKCGIDKITALIHQNGEKIAHQNTNRMNRCIQVPVQDGLLRAVPFTLLQRSA